MRSSHHTFLTADARTVDLSRRGEPALVVTSPPYPMIAMWDEVFASCHPEIAASLDRGSGVEAFALMHEVLDEVWESCYHALIPGGFICVNIGDAVRTVDGVFRLYPNTARVTRSLESAGFVLLPPILWRKQSNSPTKFMGSGMLPAGAYVTMEHETILIARKGELRRPETPDERMRRRRSAIFWEERNEWYSDLWNFAGVRQQLAGYETGIRERSGAYPLELVYRLIAMHSWEGDLVVDPFAGTGTTTAGAMALARDSVSIEMDAALRHSAVVTLEGDETVQSLRERSRSRVEAHRAFVDSRQRPAKHVNGHYGFPVVTSQETDLEVPVLSNVSATGEDLRCTYETA